MKDPIFNGRQWGTIVCIASGPSLTQEQVDLVSDSLGNVIAVNDCYAMAPWADVFYAGDLMWWRHNYLNVLNSTIAPECWTLNGNAQHLARHPQKYPGVKSYMHEIEFDRKPGLGLDKVHHGGNSGYHAVNLAYLFGAKKIVLIGYDHQHTYGKAHWFGDHDKTKFRKNAEDTDRWLRNFAELSRDLETRGVDLVNCSIETAIDSCRRSTLEKELVFIH